MPPERRQQLHAVLLAMFCAALFLGKALLPGTVLVPFPPEYYEVQGDEAAAAGRLDPAEVARGNHCMGDKYGQSLAWDRVLQQHLRAGELPLWNREIGGGVLFVTQMAQPYQPINLLLLLLPSEQWYGMAVFVQLVLIGAFAYGFVRRLGCQHASGLFAVVLATLGLWTQCKVHHNVILTAAVSLLPMLSAVHDLARGRGGSRSIAWLGLWSGLAWLSGFVIVALQASYLVLGYALLSCLSNPRGERLRPLWRIGLGFGLGALLSLAQMIPLLLAMPVSARPPEFDVHRHQLRSLDWDYLLTLLWPDLLHWASDRFYVGVDAAARFATRPPLSQLVLLHDPLGASGNWVECSFAVSIPGITAAVLAGFDRQRRRTALFFAAVAAVGFAMATGTQPFFALARLLPGLAATDLRRQLFFCSMALVVLGAIGFDRLLQRGTDWIARGLVLAIAALSGIGWLWLSAQDDGSLAQALGRWIAADAGHPQVQGQPVAVVTAMIEHAAYPGELANNLAQLRLTFGRAFLVAAAAAAALFLRRRDWRAGLLLLAAMFELWHAGLGPVQTVTPERVRTPPKVVQPVLAATAPNGVRPRFERLGGRTDARIASLYLPNLAAYHGIEDAAAYSSLPPAREEEFFLCIEPNTAGKTDVLPGGDGVGWFHDPASLQHPLCDLFGIGFVLTDQPDTAAANLIDRTPPGTGRFRLLERTSVLPRATFVREVDILPDKQQRLAALRRTDRDVAARIVLEDPGAPLPRAAAADAAPARVDIVRQDEARVQIHVACSADGYLRLADAYDPGWRAEVDGMPAPIYVADHYLRAVYLSGGDHKVEFRFDGARVLWPGRLSLLGLCILLALMLRPRQPNAA